MTEVEKMRNGLLADMSSPELQVRFEHAKKLLARMRGMSTYDEGYRKLLEELVPGMPETSVICPPFYCDHGDGTKLGEHVFVNANCTFLDGGYITIGAHTLIGPCVQIYTPHHPMDYLERRGSKEYAYPVSAGISPLPSVITLYCRPLGVVFTPSLALLSARNFSFSAL